LAQRKSKSKSEVVHWHIESCKKRKDSKEGKSDSTLQCSQAKSSSKFHNNLDK